MDKEDQVISLPIVLWAVISLPLGLLLGYLYRSFNDGMGWQGDIIGPLILVNAIMAWVMSGVILFTWIDVFGFAVGFVYGLIVFFLSGLMMDSVGDGKPFIIRLKLRRRRQS